MERFNHLDIEPKWQKLWLKCKVYESDLKSAKKPFYNLMMFPYPSAEGLHVGNMYAFVGSDIYGRFKRMQGYDVFEPIGLDGFGIHSENYAIKIGAHPMEQAKVSEKNFYRQLQEIGNGFAWQERLETYDPNYYKWTQWIFIQMFKRGLAYRKKSPVNWCPNDKTVLADEQVINGCCERCGAKVVKKDLEQWFFRITKYADRLLRNLDHIDWSEKVKIAQRNWIGKSEGSLLTFRIPHSTLHIEVFTTRADTLYGATYMVLAPDHALIKQLKDRITNYKEVQEYVAKAKRKSSEKLAMVKTGVILKGVKAINPATKELISLWVSDYVLMEYGTGAIMAVPGHDERDFEFAKKFSLPMEEVIHAEESKFPKEAYIGEGRLIHSGHFNGMDSETARKEITRFVKGKLQAHYRLRDWLISRQRYWGPPIPMIFCDFCAKEGKGEQKDMPGWFAVPEKDLPVDLPYVENFRPTGTEQSPLASVESFYKVKCPKCKKWARRETDVSDTFLDSAWYFLRYPSTRSARAGQAPWDKAITKKWLPVNMYIGGAEHSVLHLLYSRFLTMVFKDLGLTRFEEPFTRFRAHGLLIRDGAKMSKSKGNIVNPDDYIKKYGADTLRTYLMFMGPLSEGGDFRDAGISGITRFFNRICLLKEKVVPACELTDAGKRLLHKTIKKVSEDLETLHYNTSISALMILLNQFDEERAIPQAAYEAFLVMLAPFAPHLTEELYQLLRQQPFSKKTSLHRQAWSLYDETLIHEDTFTLVIQVDGRVKGKIEAEKTITEEKAKAVALRHEAVRRIVGTQLPKKIIFVAGRLINIVL